jgi:hypothetical protein
MRITLRAVFLWLVVVGDGVADRQRACDSRRSRSKAEAQKDRGNRVAAKSVAKPAAKVAAKPGSGTVAARPAAKKVARR